MYPYRSRFLVRSYSFIWIGVRRLLFHRNIKRSILVSHYYHLHLPVSSRKIEGLTIQIVQLMVQRQYQIDRFWDGCDLCRLTLGLRPRVCAFGLAPSDLRLRICVFGFASSGLRLRVCAFGLASSGLRLRVCVFGFASSGLRLRVCVFGFAPSGLRLRGNDFGRATLSGLRPRVCVFGASPSGLHLRVCVFGFASSGLRLRFH
jgi:hypothetical protein